MTNRLRSFDENLRQFSEGYKNINTTFTQDFYLPNDSPDEIALSIAASLQLFKSASHTN